jgi:alginate O-acetyltransferase complex protein AlgI
MVFSDLEFILIFLPLVLILHYLVLRKFDLRFRIIAIIFVSILFYGYEYPAYCFLILGSVAFNFCVGRMLNQRTFNRRLLLIIGLCGNLGALGYFKYAGFLVDSWVSLTGADLVSLRITLPLAISFFTFQQIAYLVDAYRERIPKHDFNSYALFILLFPQLIAGPIVRFQEFFPQIGHLGSRLQSRLSDIAIGLSFFALGLIKKSLIADNLALYVDPLFAAAGAGDPITFAEAWTSVLCFSFQIYFDFSAYSDMAIGLTRLFGIQLPFNFNSPYKASSLIDFWRRWHMTLSRFLRDFLYIPIGGNQGGQLSQSRNILIVMLLGGLWHGAGWAFVAWGALHGLGLIVNHGYRIALKNLPSIWTPFDNRLIAGAVTFLFVTAAWVPFRSDDLETAWRIWRTMCGLEGLVLPLILEPVLGANGMLHLSHAEFSNALYHGVGQAFGVIGGGAPIIPVAAVIAFLLPNSQEWLTGRDSVTVTDRKDGFLQLTIRVQSIFAWRPTIIWATALSGITFFAVAQNKSPQVFVYFQF